MDTPWADGVKGMPVMNFSDRNELDMLAGEYVLGVLSPAEKAAFEVEMLRNRDLVAAVAFWNNHLLAVAPVPIPVEPASDLWQRIERDLPGRAVDQTPRGLWNSLSFWRASSLAGIAATIFLTLRLLTGLLEPSGIQSQYLAVLQAPDQSSNWLVEVSSTAVHLRPLTPVPVNAGKALQFWTKPEGAAGPTSLGLVSPDRPTTIPLERLPMMGQNQLFEVTLEPEAGSPINRPTGPILAIGKAVRL